MRKAIVLTAFNRVDYLIPVLKSWDSVRGIEEYDFYISIDPSYIQLEVEAAIAECLRIVSYSVRMIRHKEHMGVLKHPLVVLDAMFADKYDFVIRTEDDLVVSNGILEYFNYAIERYATSPDVVSIHGHSHEKEGEEDVLRTKTSFNPWVFGTWNYKWDILKNNWDQDYSTFTDHPMNQSGFDWNFDVRLYPENGLLGVFPDVSRVKNIGAYGVHGTPDLLPETRTFKPENLKIGEAYEFSFKQLI